MDPSTAGSKGLPECTSLGEGQSDSADRQRPVGPTDSCMTSVGPAPSFRDLKKEAEVKEAEQEQTEEEFYDCPETLEVLNKERVEGGVEEKKQEDDAERCLKGGVTHQGGLVCGHHTRTDLPEPGQGVGGQFVCDGAGEEEGTDEGATEEEPQWDDEVGGRMDSDAAPKVEKAEAPPEFDDDYLREAEKNLTEEERESRRRQSLALKEKGNGQFRAAEHLEAELSYAEALGVCPVCFGDDRAVLFSNRAASRLHLGLKDQAIADCSRAVELKPDYVRAILRRAELYEKTDRLDEALGDYRTVLERDPGQRAAREACMRLPRQINDRNESMKEEVLGKLKDLGNMFLRPFGLSTSNFQVNQDADTGSYSVNMVQNSQNNNKNR